MFLNLTLASGHTSSIIASGILNPALAYLPCSRVLHVKCRLLPEELITSPDIGTRSEQLFSPSNPAEILLQRNRTNHIQEPKAEDNAKEKIQL